MVHFIRGFSLLTGYSCSQCHVKCCGTEYDLPIFQKEKQRIIQKLPAWANFVKSSKGKHWILRGDSCPFLNGEGLCILHDMLEKPLICQLYPLILYKIKQDLILTWINPCRGNGFQWVSESKNRITDNYLEQIIGKITPYFNENIGEDIDRNNPYRSISLERIEVQMSSIPTLKEESKDIVTINFTELNQYTIFHSLVKNLQSSSFQEDVNDVIQAVFYWLSWSPLGLQLSFKNSRLVFQVAGAWVELWGRDLLEESDFSIKRERILQQLGSFYASSVLPSFWKQMMEKVKDTQLKKFSKSVFLVLQGDKSQKILQEVI